MQPAFVLHRWPFQDSSYMVEMFSAQHGRFRLIAKGARRPKSRWSACLQPFTPLLISSRGRHELQTLVHAEASGDAYHLRGDCLYSGFYVNELVQRLTALYQPLDGLFTDYQQTLHLLSEATQVEPILRRFEWQLLDHLGHHFDWLHDSAGDGISATGYYQFSAHIGFVRQLEMSPGAFEGQVILRLSQFDLSDAHCLQAMKRIMRMALQPYLGDQPLRSRQLFHSLIATKDS